MNKALKKLTADYLNKGKADYDAGKMTTDAKEYRESEVVTLGYLDKMGDVYICELCQRAYEPEEINGVRKLKTFQGYTVDLRCKEFRKVEYGKQIDFIDFASS